MRYEFGTKVSVAATITEGFIVGMRALPGNPYDGHTLAEALEQVEVLIDRRPSPAVVDRGYRGHGVETTRVLTSDARRGLTPTLARLVRRAQRHRARDRPHEDRRPADALPLNGSTGDALLAVLCACGHNLRKILAHLRALLAILIAAILGAFRPDNRRATGAAAV